MSNERDTHFLHAAELLTVQLYRRFGDRLHLSYEDDKEWDTLIAQFAYDLAHLACLDINNAQMIQGVRLHPQAMLRAVQDLTQWPIIKDELQ